MSLVKKIILTIVVILQVGIFNTISAKEKRFANGDYYVGEWKKGKPNGHGIMTYADKSEYDGNWSRGVREGEGRIEYSNGIIYSGIWYNDTIVGDGYVKIDEKTFTGKFSPEFNTSGNLNGFSPIEGQLSTDGMIWRGNWSAPNVFSGTIENDEMFFSGDITTSGNDHMGKGRMTFKDTELFWDGTVENGKMINGECKALFEDTYLVASPALYEGKWVNGNFIGSVKAIDVDGFFKSFVFTVDSLGMQHGFAETSDGKYYYAGGLKNGKMEGYGTFSLNDEDNFDGFTGDWKNNKPINGSGLFSYPSAVINIANDSIYYCYSRDKSINGVIPIGKSGILDLNEAIEKDILRIQRARKAIREKKALEYYNNNYAGLVYIAKNTSFSGSFEDDLANFLFSSKTDAVIVCLPNGKVILKEIRATSSNQSFQQMVMMSLNNSENKVYNVELSPDNKSIIIKKNGYTITPTNNRRNAIFKGNGDNTITFTCQNKYIGKSSGTVRQLPVGTYYGELSTTNLSTGASFDGIAGGNVTLQILPNNRYKITDVMQIHDSFIAALYGKSKEVTTQSGSYSISSEGLLKLEKGPKMEILLGGNALFIHDQYIHAILFRQ